MITKQQLLDAIEEVGLIEEREITLRILETLERVAEHLPGELGKE